MSDIHQVEVVIHVDEALSGEQREKMVGDLLECDGIESAGFTSGREHLMLIDYDSGKLNTTEVLECVRRQNVHAEAIGL